MEYQKLRSGGRMPMVGYGTFLAFDLELETALNKALEAGYRYIDTASGYSNEHIIGKVLNEWISSGKVTRDELFVVTKLPAYGNQAEDVEKYIKKSLNDFGLEYLDMYLVHLPFGVIKGDKTEYYEMERDDGTDHVSIWKEMERQVVDGRTKAIGLSNFNIRQIQKILDNCRIKPDNLQNENHLYLQEPELVKFCSDNGIAMTSYSSLGTRGARRLMDMSWTDKRLPEMLENETLVGVAKKHGKSAAQVLLRFIVQKGVSVIPKSTDPNRLADNIRIFDFKLDSTDMDALCGQDAGEGGRIVRFLFFPKITDHPEYPFLVTK